MPIQRVQKILAHAGIASRRKCEELIKEGKVSVNNKLITIGDKADPDKDIIKVNSERIKPERKRYIILNKPKGYVTTAYDPRGRKTVIDLVDVKERIFPVGRLDLFSEGLLILTNDGDFANKVMHPRYEKTKTYNAMLDRPLTNDDLIRLNKGIVIEKRKVVPDNLFLNNKDKKNAVISIHEGRHKIVKRLFKELGYYITALKRTRIGSITLKDLASGEWRELEKKEIESIVGND